MKRIIIKNLHVPIGPLGSDPIEANVFSEVSAPQSMTVVSEKVILFDANGNPLKRKLGF